MITDINSEDQLVQATFADHLHDVLGWESVFAHNEESFGPTGTLSRARERDVVLVRDLRAGMQRLNPDLPESAREQAGRGRRIEVDRSPWEGLRRAPEVVDISLVTLGRSTQFILPIHGVGYAGVGPNRLLFSTTCLTP